MTLDDLRKKVIYQNTIDTWIAFCEEKNIEWYETENYKKFIGFLTKNNLSMKKFPLCCPYSPQAHCDPAASPKVTSCKSA